MRLFRGNTEKTKERIPRYWKNITEEEDWKNFFELSGESKELLCVSQKLQQNSWKGRIMRKVKLRNLKINKLMEEEPEYCICTHEFDHCKFCQSYASVSNQWEEDVCKLPILTEAEVEEFYREDFENWKEIRKEVERDKRREKRTQLTKKLLEPIQMPETELCVYEKIRNYILAQRKTEWAELEKQWEKDNN